MLPNEKWRETYGPAPLAYRSNFSMRYGLTDPVNVTVPEPASGLVVEVALVGTTFQVSLPLPVSGEAVAVVHASAGVRISVLPFFVVVIQALPALKSRSVTAVPTVTASVLALSTE